MLAHCLGPGHPPLQGMLEQLLAVCRPYLHPSNSGPWSGCLAQLLNSLAENIAMRLDRQRHGELPYAALHQLAEADLAAFVDCLQQPLFLGLFGKSQMVAWAARCATKVLAAIAPVQTLQPIVDRMLPHMAVGSPHPQTFVACLSALADALPALLDDAQFPGGRGLLPTLLLGTVDGLEHSDKARTRTTLKLYGGILSSCYLAPLHPDVAYTAADGDAAASSCLVEWAEKFVPKALGLINHQAKPDKHDALDHLQLRETLRLFFSSVDPAMYATGLEVVATFVKTNLFHNALRPIGHIVEECAAGSPAEALAVLLPPAVAKLTDDGSSEEEERCALRVLAKATKLAGAAILPHGAVLLQVVTKHTAKADRKEVAKEANKLLCCLLHGLASTYTVDHARNPVGKNVLMADWGKKPTAHTAEVQWHTPTGPELELAGELATAVGRAGCAALAAMAAGGAATKQERCNALQRIRAVLRSPLDWRRADEDAVGQHSPSRGEATGRPPLVRRCLAAYAHPLPLPELHDEIGLQLDAFAASLALPKPVAAGAAEDPEVPATPGAAEEQVGGGGAKAELETLRTLCKTMALWVAGHGEKGRNRKVQLLHHTKAMASDPLDNSTRGRPWIVRRVGLQHHFRQFCNPHTVMFTPRRQALLDHLTTLATNPYSTVRKAAQTGVSAALRAFPWRKVPVAKEMTTLLQRGVVEVDDGAANGAVHVLTDPQVMSRLAKDFGLLKQFVLAVSAQLPREKKSLQLRVDRMFMSMLGRVCFPTTAPPPAGTHLLLEGWAAAYVPAGALEKAAAAATADAVRAVEEHLVLVAELERLAGEEDAAKVHWKQALVAQACLTFCAGAGGTKAPAAGTASRLVSALLAPDFLARRLAVVSATVVAGLNQPLLELTSTPVGRPVDLAAEYAKPVPKTSAGWAAAEFFDCFDFGDPAAGHQGPTPPGALAVKSAGPAGASGAPPAALEAAGLGLLCREDAAQLAALVDHLVADHRSDADGQVAGSMGQGSVAGGFLSVIYRRVPAAQAGFSLADANMWDKFFRLAGLPLWTQMLPLLLPLITETTAGSGSSFVGERDKQAVASEIVAGAIRGSKYWGYDQLTTLWQGLLPIWELVAKHAAGDILDDWACALDVAAARRDPRRLWWLTEWLAARDLHANTDTKQCVAVLTLTEAVRAS